MGQGGVGCAGIPASWAGRRQDSTELGGTVWSAAEAEGPGLVPPNIPSRGSSCCDWLGAGEEWVHGVGAHAQQAGLAVDQPHLTNTELCPGLAETSDTLSALQEGLVDKYHVDLYAFSAHS